MNKYFLHKQWTFGFQNIVGIISQFQSTRNFCTEVKKGKNCLQVYSSLQECTFSLGKTRNAPPLSPAKTYPESRVIINEMKLQI